MVAVLEVPDSPTRSSGLFIFTIWSRIQLALVVSTVGTTAKTEDEGIEVEEGTRKSQNVEIGATCLCERHLICRCLTAHRHELYLEYLQTSCRSRECIWGPESSRKPTSPVCHQNGSHTEMADILYGANHLVISNIIRISEIIKGDYTCFL